MNDQFWEMPKRLETTDYLGRQSSEVLGLSVLRNALEALPDPVAILDEAGRIRAVNAAWRRFGDLNGLQLERHALGANYLETCDLARGECAQEAPFVAAGLRRLLREKRGSFKLAYACSSESEQRWFELQAASFDMTACSYVMVIHHDITAIRQNELDAKQKEQKLAETLHTLEMDLARAKAELKLSTDALNAFSCLIAHSLRAPVRWIHAFASLLDETCKTPDARSASYTRHIRESAEQIQLILQALVLYAEVSSRRFPLGWMDPSATLSKVLQELEKNPLAAGTQVRVDALLPTICANPALFEIVFRNLLSNAVKFARPGAVPRIRIWAETSRHRVRFCIQDNGRGLDLDLQQQLFSPVHRLIGLSASCGGAGMGLVLVQAAAEKMRAAVGVKSKPAEGSVFWIEFPDNPASK